MAKECGNSDCGVSCDVAEELTFGRGELSSLGYWEFPCTICEAAWHGFTSEWIYYEVDLLALETLGTCVKCEADELEAYWYHTDDGQEILCEDCHAKEK